MGRLVVGLSKFGCKFGCKYTHCYKVLSLLPRRPNFYVCWFVFNYGEDMRIRLIQLCKKRAWELFCGRKATSGKSEEHDYRVALLANLILAHAQ